MAPVHVKDPKLVRAGQRSAAARWGEWPHRVVRLDRLDPATREIVVAILRARRNAAASDDGHE